MGVILSLTILLEIDRIDRFTTRQQFASYARLVRPRQESADKWYGSHGAKIGNPNLRWAFAEAAVYAAQRSVRINKHLERLSSKHGAGKAKALLAHQLGRAVYYMLLRGQVFDEERFLRG